MNADDPITFVWNDSGGKTFTVTSNSGWYIYMAGQESWCQALISEGKRGHDQVVTLKAVSYTHLRPVAMVSRIKSCPSLVASET